LISQQLRTLIVPRVWPRLAQTERLKTQLLDVKMLPG